VVWDNEDVCFDSCGMFSGIVLWGGEMGLLCRKMEMEMEMEMENCKLQIGKNPGLRFMGVFLIIQCLP